MMMRPRQLDVYKRAFALAMAIHKVSVDWPKHEQFGGMADQVRRASKGICANLAEGLAKVGKPEQRRFLNMAVGSTEEIRVWLEFAGELNYVVKTKIAEWDAAYDEIGRMLVGLIVKRTEE